MAKEWRTKVELKFEAEQDADGASVESPDAGPPTSFALYRTEIHEYQPRTGGAWHEDFSQTRRECVADGITITCWQTAATISNGVDWLVYLGDAGTPAQKHKDEDAD